jgi:Ca2+:H+ antiporter
MTPPPKHPRGSLAGLPWWTVAAPLLSAAILAGAGFGVGGYYVILIALGVAGSVFAAVLLILTGIIGLCLLVGGIMHREQIFSLDGVSAALVALASIAVMTMVFPNFTVTAPGPFFSSGQLILIAIVSVVVYGSFIFTQTVGHRQFFLDGAPDALVGVVIADIVLLPEGLAAVRAARQNRLQTSLNLALGSALASIGLTIPAVSALSLWLHSKLMLGIDAKSMVLLLLSLLVAMLVLRTGRTIIPHGVVLLVIFAVYLFTTVVP